MKNKILKVLFVIIAMMSIIIIAASSTYATVTLPWDQTTISSDTSGNTATAVKNISGTILGVVQVIGVAVAVIMLIVLAIKYISAAPNDKAEIKKHAIVYVVGAVVLFAASGILGIVRGFADTINYSNNGGSNARQGVGAEQRLRILREQLQNTTDADERRRIQEEIDALVIYLH